MIIESYNRFLHLLEESTTGKMVKANQFESTRMFVDYYLLDPGHEQKPHSHADNDKLYFVLEGRGTFLLGEHEHTIGAGEGCVATAGQPHGVRNDSDARLVLLVVMAPHPGMK
jgi:mannose-6-phosphate isomerase-like protein (cupin superfamily)